ncbi:MAG: hypothetical protein R3F11_22420 [Verrucomicrobiales bacterium]
MKKTLPPRLAVLLAATAALSPPDLPAPGVIEKKKTPAEIREILTAQPWAYWERLETYGKVEGAPQGIVEFRPDGTATLSWTAGDIPWEILASGKILLFPKSAEWKTEIELVGSRLVGKNIGSMSGKVKNVAGRKVYGIEGIYQIKAEGDPKTVAISHLGDKFFAIRCGNEWQGAGVFRDRTFAGGITLLGKQGAGSIGTMTGTYDALAKTMILKTEGVGADIEKMTLIPKSVAKESEPQETP